MPVRYRLSTTGSGWTRTFVGTIVLATPTVQDLGGGVLRIRYGLRGSFVVGSVTYRLSGTVPVFGGGAGLWDSQFAIRVSASDGNAYTWESTTGAFFKADGAGYPAHTTATAIAYSIFPEKLSFINSTFLRAVGPGSAGLGAGTLVAERICRPSVRESGGGRKRKAPSARGASSKTQAPKAAKRAAKSARPSASPSPVKKRRS